MTAVQYKVVVVGAGGTGKSSWVSRLQGSEFQPKYLPTMGVEVHPFAFYTPRGPIQFNVWDCAGQERLRGLDDGYYINANAAIVFVDDGNEWEKFVGKLQRFGGISIFYVRNKSDLAFRHAENRLHRFPRVFTDMSAKNNEACEKPFEEIARYFGALKDGEHFVEANIELPELIDTDAIREYEEELAHAADTPLDDE